MSRPISTENKFRALAHATRRKVVELLLRKPLGAGELAGHFNHSRAVLSKHLRILEGVGLVAFRRTGTSLEYRLVPESFESLHQWISRLPKAP
jgi:DNA-binding transcriptional ArsR family regulator